MVKLLFAGRARVSSEHGGRQPRKSYADVLASVGRSYQSTEHSSRPASKSIKRRHAVTSIVTGTLSGRAQATSQRTKKKKKNPES